MSHITISTYEINEAGLPLIEDWLAEMAAYQARGFAVSDRFGAVGYVPSKYSPPSLLVFQEETAPEGFVAVRKERGFLVCRPRKNTKAGKAAVEALESIGVMPSVSALAAVFGYGPASIPTDGRHLYFPSEVRVKVPVKRHFLRLPRFEDDGFVAPAGLTEITNGEFVAAVEAHNAKAKDVERSRQEPSR